MRGFAETKSKAQTSKGHEGDPEGGRGKFSVFSCVGTREIANS